MHVTGLKPKCMEPIRKLMYETFELCKLSFETLFKYMSLNVGTTG